MEDDTSAHNRLPACIFLIYSSTKHSSNIVHTTKLTTSRANIGLQRYNAGARHPRRAALLSEEDLDQYKHEVDENQGN